jgi:3-deoxy-D-manno-octulosonate 8-phosphate phosphatase (KDO 8-P phosphatase)
MQAAQLTAQENPEALSMSAELSVARELAAPDFPASRATDRRETANSVPRHPSNEDEKQSTTAQSDLLSHGNNSDLALAHLASPEVLDRARKIKLFLMDVDGTLTDGGVCLISATVADGSGTSAVTEMKVFNAQDGQGLSLAHTMGLQTGFITGRHSPAVEKRAQELKVAFVYLGQAKKTVAFEECMEKAGVTEEEVAYMGDDLPDIPLAKRAGLGVCVADGAPELAAVCHFTTQRTGGRGAAREVVELILKAQGRWEEAVPKALA